MISRYTLKRFAGSMGEKKMPCDLKAISREWQDWHISKVKIEILNTIENRYISDSENRLITIKNLCL
jgi:hypothetical protein